MILLTKTINAELDKAKLPELTVQRTEAGTLALVGRECGKQIINFSSMPISKKLSVAEREIMMDDYLMPTIYKHGKDLISLITLMKDQKLEKAVETFKEDNRKIKKLELSTNSHYDHSLFSSIVSYYQVRTNEHTSHYDESHVRFDVKEGKYSSEVNVNAGDSKGLTNEIKLKAKQIEQMIKTLDKWKDLNEALDVKNEHVAKLQNDMKIKCSL